MSIVWIMREKVGRNIYPTSAFQPHPLPHPPSSLLLQCRELFENKSKIIIATDNDAPGDALAEELARRLGKERCWRVRWPRGGNGAGEPGRLQASGGDRVPGGAHRATVEVMPPEDSGLNPAMAPSMSFSADVSDRHDTAASAPSSSRGGGGVIDDGFRKDANEVLVRDGPDRLRELIEAAEPTPINGLYRFRCGVWIGPLRGPLRLHSFSCRGYFIICLSRRNQPDLLLPLSSGIITKKSCGTTLR